MTDFSLPANAEVLDVDLLTVFCWVAQTRNFSRAADRLNTSQPVITRKVNRLEEQLGVRLFLRSNRGCELTKAGEILASKAPGVLMQLAQLREEIAHSEHVISGTISIGVTHLAGLVMVPHLLPVMASRWPKLHVNMVDSDSRVLCARLLTRELSLAVCYDPDMNSELVSTPLFMEKLYLVGVPSEQFRKLKNPTLRDLATLPLILPSGQQTIRVLLEDAFAEIGLPLRPVYEATTVNLLRAMALQGTGYTILSLGSVADDVAAGRLMAIPLAEKGLSLGLSLVSTSEQLKLRNVQLMHDFVYSEIMSVVQRGLWPGRSSQR